jgi:hypothetical protein
LELADFVDHYLDPLGSSFEGALERPGVADDASRHRPPYLIAEGAIPDT